MDNTYENMLKECKKMSQEEKDSQLSNIVYYERPTELKALLEAGANPNHTIKGSDVTPLMYAAYNNRFGNVFELLQAGAKLSPTNKGKETPFPKTFDKGYLKTAYLLAVSMNAKEIKEELELHPKYKFFFDLVKRFSAKAWINVLMKLDPVFIKFRNSNEIFCTEASDIKFNMLYLSLLLEEDPNENQIENQIENQKEDKTEDKKEEALPVLRKPTRVMNRSKSLIFTNPFKTSPRSESESDDNKELGADFDKLKISSEKETKTKSSIKHKFKHKLDLW